MTRRSPHRTILILFTLVMYFVLYNAIASVGGLSLDRVAAYTAVATFLVTALVSIVFKALLEG